MRKGQKFLGCLAALDGCVTATVILLVGGLRPSAKGSGSACAMPWNPSFTKERLREFGGPRGLRTSAVSANSVCPIIKAVVSH